MIILENNKHQYIGIPLHNFISSNTDDENNVWVAYWAGDKVFRFIACHTLEEIQHLIYIARHGKEPTKGLLCPMK